MTARYAIRSSYAGQLLSNFCLGPVGQVPIDDFIYALRNFIKRCINRRKNARRVATRYDKTAASHLGFVHVVSMRPWTKRFVNRA